MDSEVPPSGGPPPVLSSATPHPDRCGRWRWLVHLVLLVAYPVVIGIAGAQRASGQVPALGHGPKALVIVIGIQFIIFATVFFLAWLASRATFDDLLLRWRGGIWTIPLGLAYSILLRLALGVVAIVVVILLVAARIIRPEDIQHLVRTNRPDVGALVDISALRHNPLYFWLTITLVSFVLAGLREELWRSGVLAGLRAVWPRTFNSTAGQIGAAAIAAVVFGLGHLAQGPLAACAAGVLGMGLGIIMVLHRSIWPAVIAHGAFDATTFGILPWVLEKLQNLQ